MDTAKKHPLAEVFGFPADNHSPEATRVRQHRLCPFGNKVPNCTKDKAQDPLGVCSILEGDGAVITCPIRFREGWRIAQEAAAFFFPKRAKWTSLTEVKLKNKHGESAGNIDVVLVSYDTEGIIIDYGSLEIQSVYISGNIRNVFNRYMGNPRANSNMDWSHEKNYPHADFLSSSRKRLLPQLTYKGGILNSWGKKQAVAIDRPFYNSLPTLPEVEPEKADLVWHIYELILNKTTNTRHLTIWKRVFARFEETLETVSKTEGGDPDEFIQILQSKLDEKLESPPEVQPLQGFMDP